MLVFNNFFYKNKKSKLYFGDRVAVLNDFIYQTGGSTYLLACLLTYLLTYLLACLLAYLLACLFACLLAYLLTYSHIF
jgi:hypothetical protein